MLALGAFLGSRNRAPSTVVPPPAPAATDAASAEPPSDLSRVLRSPPSSVAELGVLTDRPADALAPILAAEALAASVVQDRFCGDPASCDSVARALRDPKSTQVDVVARSDWDIDRVDVDAAASGLPPAARRGLARATRVVAIRATSATTPPAMRAVAMRTAFAAAASIAKRIDGLVYDPLLQRLESAQDFARHVPGEAEPASAFRRDRVQLLYQPRGQGIVRILTAGLSRWGAPDVEAAAVPTAASERIAEVVLGVAEALSGGLTAGHVTLSRETLARVRGTSYPADAGLPADQDIVVALAPEHPEPGDPNDFFARVVPPAGEGPMGYLALAEAFFGPGLAASPGEGVLHGQASRARRNLGPSLERWTAGHAKGDRLLLRVPFPIPGDAGSESMWIEVTGYGDATVSGTLVDEPLAATDVEKGQSITRPRGDVEDIDERAAR
ncbi:MAG: DUF2314 domain-containing protein [Polyangiaceae bacterium]